MSTLNALHMKEQVGGLHRHFPTSRYSRLQQILLLQQSVIVLLPVDAHRAAEKSVLAVAASHVDLGWKSIRLLANKY